MLPPTGQFQYGQLGMGSLLSKSDVWDRNVVTPFMLAVQSVDRGRYGKLFDMICMRWYTRY